MHADVDAPIFELDRRTVWPDLQPCQILRWHLLQRADPLPGDQEPSIPRRHDLDGIAVGHIADCLCPNFGLRFRLAGGERRRVFGVGNLVLSRG